MPVTAFLHLKVRGLVISGIFVLHTEMEKRLRLLKQPSANAGVFHARIDSCIVNPWNHPPLPLPPNKSKYLKEIMAKSLWKIHLRSA